MSDPPRLVPDPPPSAARFGDGGDYYRPGLATLEPEYVLAAQSPCFGANHIAR